MTALIAKSHFRRRAGAEAVRELAGCKKVSVLVVEDDHGCRQSYEAVFRHPMLANCSVQFADSVNEAMALIATNVFDLCLLDYQLGSHTGSDLVREWRDFGYDMPFVCVSAHSDPEVDAEMQRLGAIGFVEKSESLNPVALERTIRYALSNYWRQRAA